MPAAENMISNTRQSVLLHSGADSHVFYDMTKNRFNTEIVNLFIFF